MRPGSFLHAVFAYGRSRLKVSRPLVRLSLQLMDLSDVFSATQIEFLRSAISQPEGSIQAICVPGGAVRTKPLPLRQNAV